METICPHSILRHNSDSHMMTRFAIQQGRERQDLISETVRPLGVQKQQQKQIDFTENRTTANEIPK